MRSWITREPIDTAAVLELVRAPEAGAVLLFLGVVRDHNDGRAVTGIHYDAYATMAERVLAQIVAEAADRIGTERIAAVHRIGELDVGETSVAIAVASPHRAETFDGARYIIEEIKQRLPVWKEERYLDGDRGWLAGSVPVAASGSTRMADDDAG